MDAPFEATEESDYLKYYRKQSVYNNRVAYIAIKGICAYNVFKEE